MHNNSFFLPKIHALLLGEAGSGKSSLSLRYMKNEFSKHYTATICNLISEKTITTSLRLFLWDMPGLGKYPHFSLTSFSYKESRLFIYCIDLSKPINKVLIEETIRKIRLRDEQDKNPIIFLVGTKSDIKSQQAIPPGELYALAAEHRAKAFITSAKNNEGIDDLFTEVTSSAKKLHEQKENDKAARDAAALAAQIRERNHIETQLHASLKILKAAIDNLPQQDNAKKIELYAAADRLIKALKNTNPLGKRDDINKFYDKCREIVSRPISLAMRNVLQAVVFVAIAAIVTLLCAAIGFTIGLAAGAWLGPGAFITAIVGGTAAAKAALATSSVIGVCASYYATNHFFKPTPVLVAAQQVKTGASDFYPNYPGDMTDISELNQLQY